MKKAVLIVWLSIIGIIIFQGMAAAGGCGPFISWGRETPEVEFPSELLESYLEPYLSGTPAEIQAKLTELERLGDGLKSDNTNDHLTFGILYDSAPRQDKLFSNRVALGFDIATETKVEDVEDVDLRTIDPTIPADAYASLVGSLDEPSTYGGSFTNTFAFALIRLSLFKWWLGPGLRTAFNYYDLDDSGKALSLSAGGGLETGVNLHLGTILSLCVSGGYHWSVYGYAAGDDSVGSVKWGDGPYYFLQAAILFHTGMDKNPWK